MILLTNLWQLQSILIKGVCFFSSAWWDAYDLNSFGEDDRDDARGQWGLLGEDAEYLSIHLVTI